MIEKASVEKTMSRISFAARISLTLTGIVLGMAVAATVAESPASAKPSSYAPAKDLRSQVDYFLGRIEEDLADPSDFGDDQSGRIEKDAVTLAAIALVLGMHDEENDLKKAAPAIIEASGDVAMEAEDYEAAKKAFAKLKKAMTTTSDDELEWEPVTDVALLMVQVPIINNSLRRGVSGRRFSRSIDRNAGYAATLAAIAQASLVDDSYCEDDEDEAKWRKFCRDMRTAAAEVNVAVRRNDQKAAVAALPNLVKTCDDCHDVFREEE